MLFLAPLFCSKIVFCQDKAQNSSDHEIRLNLGSSGVQIAYTLPIKLEQDIRLKTGLFFLQFKKPIGINLAENSSINLRPNFQAYGVSFAAEKPLLNWLTIYAESRFMLHQKWHLNLSTDNSIDLNGLSLEADDFGTIDASLKWWSLQPGIGILLGKNKPENTWNVAANIATYYMGGPKVSLRYEGFLETTTLQDALPMIEHNMRNYSFFPAIGINISYKVKDNRN
ncbi:hypothetical protein [uncultured Arcticibacterium sp.]|uniref:hypothetical protein n=1 Tax=uncultured Arcticibacterium sp. TaxID=2173042 RepID=UPI0030FA3772